MICRKTVMELSGRVWYNFLVRLEQMGIVGGCPFWKQKGGRYEYIRSAYIAAGYFCRVNILRQQKQPQVTEKAILLVPIEDSL